jgi:hypothetical protein
MPPCETLSGRILRECPLGRQQKSDNSKYGPLIGRSLWCVMHYAVRYGGADGPTDRPVSLVKIGNGERGQETERTQK